MNFPSYLRSLVVVVVVDGDVVDVIYAVIFVAAFVVVYVVVFVVAAVFVVAVVGVVVSIIYFFVSNPYGLQPRTKRAPS